MDFEIVVGFVFIYLFCSHFFSRHSDSYRERQKKKTVPEYCLTVDFFYIAAIKEKVTIKIQFATHERQNTTSSD